MRWLDWLYDRLFRDPVIRCPACYSDLQMGVDTGGIYRRCPKCKAVDKIG